MPFNPSNTQQKTTPYNWYIVIGFLYVIVKIIFVLAGYLHTGAIFHGLIPTALTVAGGFLALREFKPNASSVWHIILVILPIISFVLTPIYMYLREHEMWLTNGRLEVLIIYEMLAAAQLIIALVCMRRNNKSVDRP